MKRKSLATLLSGFLTVCLTGVGFASWLITGGETKTTEAGAVTAEKVSDQRVKITELAVTEAEIRFGMCEDETTTNTPWLKNNSTSKEDLTATLSFKVTNAKSYGKEINFKFEAENKKTELDSAVSKGYIVLPTIAKIENDKFTSDDATLFTIEVKFAWGAYFGSKNPYTYFNNTYAHAGVDSNKKDDDGESLYNNAGDEAAAVLGELYALNQASYKITVTSVAKDA